MLKLKFQYFGHLIRKNWLIGKDPDAGRDWGWEENRMTEDEMVEWYHQLNGHEFEQSPRAGDGQGGLACCSPLGSQRVGHEWVTKLNWNLAECLAYVYDVLNKFLLKNWANDIRVKVSLFLSHHLTTGFYKLEINIYTPNLSLHGRPSRHTNMHETQSVSWT